MLKKKNTIFDLEIAYNTYLKSQDHPPYAGELFLEKCIIEEIKLENSIIKSATYKTKSGLGARAYQDDFTSYVHSSIISESSIKEAMSVVSAAFKNRKNCNIKLDNKKGKEQQENSKFNEKNESTISAPPTVNQDLQDKLYGTDFFIQNIQFEKKIEFLKRIEGKIYSNFPNIVKNVSISMTGKWQLVNIIKEDSIICDVRPLVYINTKVIIQNNGVMESGTASIGGAFYYDDILNEQTLNELCEKSVQQATNKSLAISAPNGEYPLVLGNGFAGVLIHEAIGHGLEADAIYKKSSVFTNLLGKQVASKGVTIIDNGKMKNMRGSLNFDDEGSKTCENILIENGKLVNFMCDNKHAKLLKMQSSANCRRESSEFIPIPRMTNTYMLGEETCSRQEMIESVKYGVFAKEFSGGQVDITSGKFVFAASEAYLIENGKITTPIKDAMIIDNCIDSLKKIVSHGNDFELVNGSGFCGKDGQTVAVGIGQASCLLSKITIGG